MNSPSPSILSDEIERRAKVQGFIQGIPWSLHLRAWDAYKKKWNSSQSAERIHERGGFSDGELDDFIPGWRDEVSTITRLESELQSLREREAWRTDLENAPYAAPCNVRYTLETITGATLGEMFVVAERRACGQFRHAVPFDGVARPTHYSPITPPSTTNTDTQAPLREEKS